MKPNQLVGFWARRRASAWLTSVNPTLDANSNGWTGFTLRQWYASGAISGTSGSQVRITLEASSTAGFVLVACYIGVGASSGDVYDFDTTPTQILFSGIAGVTLGTGATVVSDAATFTILPSRSLVVSAYFSTATSIRSSAGTNYSLSRGYSKAGNDVTTVNATGYAAATSENYLVKKIESFI